MFNQENTLHEHGWFALKYPEGIGGFRNFKHFESHKICVNSFFPNVPFLYLLKTPKGVGEGCIGNNRANKY